MLIATDLDGTFLAGDPDARNQLYQLIADHSDIKLVFVTGRGLEVVMPLLTDPTIPTPDFIICDVGATVVDGTTLQPVQPIQHDIDKLWPGERAVVEAMAAFPGLERQDVPQQRRCSYFCAPAKSRRASPKLPPRSAATCSIRPTATSTSRPWDQQQGQHLRRLVDVLAISPDDAGGGDTPTTFDVRSRFRGCLRGGIELALLERRATGSALSTPATPAAAASSKRSSISTSSARGTRSGQPYLNQAGKSGAGDEYHRLP